MKAVERDKKIADAKINRPQREYAEYSEATGKTKVTKVRHSGDGQLRKAANNGPVSQPNIEA